MAGPLILLICSRLGRIAARFAAVAARVGSGTLRAVPRRAERRPAGGSSAGARPASSSAGQQLPRGFGWLVRLAPGGAVHGSQLQHLLADPEMAALIAAAPQVGRLLRPLCRMLAVEPTPGLRRERAGRPAPAATAPARTTEPGEAGPGPQPPTTPLWLRGERPFFDRSVDPPEGGPFQGGPFPA